MGGGYFNRLPTITCDKTNDKNGGTKEKEGAKTGC